MIKRISLLIAAALLVATMAMAGLAAPLFADSGKNPAGIKIGNKSTNPNDGNGAVKNGSFKPGKKAPGQRGR